MYFFVCLFVCLFLSFFLSLGYLYLPDGGWGGLRIALSFVDGDFVYMRNENVPMAWF